MGKYCLFCGTANEKEAHFCIKCGADLQRPASLRQNVDFHENYEKQFSTIPMQDTKQLKGKNISVVLAVLIFVLVITFVFFFIARKGTISENGNDMGEKAFPTSITEGWDLVGVWEETDKTKSWVSDELNGPSQISVSKTEEGYIFTAIGDNWISETRGTVIEVTAEQIHQEIEEGSGQIQLFYKGYENGDSYYLTSDGTITDMEKIKESTENAENTENIGEVPEMPSVEECNEMFRDRNMEYGKVMHGNLDLENVYFDSDYSSEPEIMTEGSEGKVTYSFYLELPYAFGTAEVSYFIEYLDDGWSYIGFYDEKKEWQYHDIEGIWESMNKIGSEDHDGASQLRVERKENGYVFSAIGDSWSSETKGLVVEISDDEISSSMEDGDDEISIISKGRKGEGDYCLNSVFGISDMEKIE